MKCIKIETFLPHRNKITKVYLLSCVFLSYLKFAQTVCMGHCPEKWRDRFTDLKIHWSVFDLDISIVREFSVQWLKTVISRLCPV